MSGRPVVVFAVPDGIDDPARVSGGNVYDRRLAESLRPDGWEVRLLPVTDAPAALETALAGVSDGALVLVDGLLVQREPAALPAQSGRLRFVVLAHMPPPEDGPGVREAFRSARRIVATSAWTRSELIAQDAAEPARIVVAHPGTDAAPASRPSAAGGRLLCVGVVAPHKGQDVLVAALAAARDVPGWTCTIAGSTATEPGFVAELHAAVAAEGLGDRIRFAGVLTGSGLGDAYAGADLLVGPSRSESYGMAVAEALARGIPVVASAVGGIPEAIAGGRGAVTVPPGDAWALERVLRRWWASAEWRAELATAARDARASRPGWADTAATVGRALREVAAEAPAAHPGPVGTAARS
ncbi:glycosyltransferase family 4 protein [Leifsonia virtsii]|uniref:D-inositol 3-phosphate glycosyltransferase n=1 Tax=Leifsonia virtsii TaxID=3035915 RepID=A0ABT8J3D1_9MICO|nr:glycosyltransferase family 4 protein [Leifsonia virtsii]MDN4599146.1 glycosyltransferase family 4 protein [Leifsonia virtsii]